MKLTVSATDIANGLNDEQKKSDVKRADKHTKHRHRYVVYFAVITEPLYHENP